MRLETRHFYLSSAHPNTVYWRLLNFLFLFYILSFKIIELFRFIWFIGGETNLSKPATISTELLCCRSLHHRHVQEVPPGALRLLVLPQATQQGHLQGAERQALLPRVLRQALRLRRRHVEGAAGVGAARAGWPDERWFAQRGCEATRRPTLFTRRRRRWPRELCIYSIGRKRVDIFPVVLLISVCLSGRVERAESGADVTLVIGEMPCCFRPHTRLVRTPARALCRLGCSNFPDQTPCSHQDGKAKYYQVLCSDFVISYYLKLLKYLNVLARFEYRGMFLFRMLVWYVKVLTDFLNKVLHYAQKNRFFLREITNAINLVSKFIYIFSQSFCRTESAFTLILVLWWYWCCD